jgi:hypothetical protein
MRRADVVGGMMISIASLMGTDSRGAEDVPSIPIDCKISECAQRMVDIATKLMDANAKLELRVSQIEAGQKGMIAAFDGPECPRTWVEFKGAEGKFLIGANGLNQDGTKIQAGQEGGSSQIVLSTNNVPSITGEFSSGAIQIRRFGSIPSDHGEFNMLTDSTRPDFNMTSWHTGVSFQGKNEPIKFAPPYRAVTFCVKQ